MKTKNFFAVLAIFGSLTCCAQTNHQTKETGLLVSDTKMSDDYDTEIKHFEDIAKEMQARQEKLLRHHENKSYLYGRQAQDLKSHCWALYAIIELRLKKPMKI